MRQYCDNNISSSTVFLFGWEYCVRLDFYANCRKLNKSDVANRAR